MVTGKRTHGQLQHCVKMLLDQKAQKWDEEWIIGNRFPN